MRGIYIHVEVLLELGLVLLVEYADFVISRQIYGVVGRFAVGQSLRLGSVQICQDPECSVPMLWSRIGQVQAACANCISNVWSTVCNPQ